MNLVGLSPAAFAIGLAALALTLGALHVLRVRMRRQVVDSLLFFRSAALQARPRVLGQRLARLGSFLVGLLLLALAWAAFAEPFASPAAASRVIVVDRSAAAQATTSAGTPLAAQFDAELAPLVDEFGLGPRGAVLAVGPSPRTVLRADEPSSRLAERLATLPIGGAPANVASAVVAAAKGLRVGDEVLVLGGPPRLPEELDGVRVRRAELPAAQAMPRAARSTPRLAVFVDDGLPDAIAFALEARGDVDRTTRDAAALAVVRDAATLPAKLPALIVESAAEGTLVELRVTADCPAPLSLRDRTRRATPGFRPRADETVWLGDARNELALVAASAGRIRIARALLDELLHRDVPLLLDAALDALRVDGPQSALPIAAVDARPADALDALGGSGAWAPLLLALGLAVVLLDAWLLSRGRVA